MFNKGDRVSYLYGNERHIGTVVEDNGDGSVLVLFDEKWQDALHDGNIPHLPSEECRNWWCTPSNLTLIKEATPKQPSINDYFKEHVIKHDGLTLEQYVEKEDAYERELENLKDSIKYILVKKANNERNLQATRKLLNVNFEERINSIKDLDKIVNVKFDFDTGGIIAETSDIYFTVSNGGMYYAGRYRIEFFIGDISLKFFNLVNDCKRRSAWGKDCHHPHVSNTGKPCLGNTHEMLVYLTHDHEYQAIFDVAIAFLESANLEDCAGRHAQNWDRVDPNTLETIREGYRDYDDELFYYDENDADDDSAEDPCRCDKCGEVCNETWFVRSENIDICEDCRDEYYSYCEECNEYVHQDEMGYVNNYGSVCASCLDDSDRFGYCDDCEEWHREDYVQYIESVDKSVCDNCLDDYTRCEECDELYPNDEVRRVASTDSNVCDDCLDDDYFSCDGCGQYEKKDNMYTTDETNELCQECYEDALTNDDDDLGGR